MNINDIEFTDEMINRLRLFRSNKIGSLSYRFLLQSYRTPCAAIEAISITHNIVTKDEIIKEIYNTTKDGWNYLFSGDLLYPRQMDRANSSPIIMYKGNINLLKQRLISIVGTRDPSLSGINFCKQIAKDFINKDYIIVSGLAEGIDTVVHSVDYSKTIGIMAGGPHTLTYDKLANKIIENNGLIITDQPYNMPLLKYHFPNRNKIIAALCNSLIVIDAHLNSGSLITAHNANDLNKNIYIMPGRPGDIKTEGGNLFLQKNMKKDNIYMILKSDDVILNTSLKEDNKQSFTMNYTDAYNNKILSLLTTSSLSINTLAEYMNIDISLLLTSLANLEIDGKILIYNCSIYLK